MYSISANLIYITFVLFFEILCSHCAVSRLLLRLLNYFTHFGAGLFIRNFHNATHVYGRFMFTDFEFNYDKSDFEAIP